MRPGEPTRSTLSRWVQTCRGCGASAPDLARLPVSAKRVVDSNQYRAVPKRSEQAFLRWAMIAGAIGEPSEAGQATLEAAWMLDDAGRDAAELRRLAASLLAHAPTMQDQLRLVDVLRRAGEFDAAQARIADLLARRGLDETSAAILAYQQDLIASRDPERHLLSSALRPPAQRPHVTHGRDAGKADAGNDKAAKKGLWQRFTGRS
jgi:hypothetical protein